MKPPYGFYLTDDGAVALDHEKADTVRLIYRQYLSGMSLCGIADLLYTQNIPSPKGKERWTQAVISAILSNKKYIGTVVSFDEYLAVQGEKGRRSNIDEDTKQRKATRYSSQSVLGGLLVCEECSCNYRRITRPSGEVVWRCANRVEHGKRLCKNSPSVAEQEVKDAICAELNMSAFDDTTVKDAVDRVTVMTDGHLGIERKEQTMAQYFGW